jgi:transposase-like protein
MELARSRYGRDLKIAAMREIDGGRRVGEVARRLELSPKLLERWRGEWQARGERAFPGSGRRDVRPAQSEAQRIGELERKIGQLTMENDFLKKALEHLRDHHPPAVVSGEAACLRKSVKPRKAAANKPMMGMPGKPVLTRRSGGKR